MKEKNVKITAVSPDGKLSQVEVSLAYCFATEIGYKKMTGEDITDFMQEAAVAVSGDTPRMPDIEKSIYAILASMMAYYEAKGEECPVKDTDLMNHATPQELGQALGTVIGLRTQFYKLPAGEPENKPDEGEGRRRKNA